MASSLALSTPTRLISHESMIQNRDSIDSDPQQYPLTPSKTVYGREHLVEFDGPDDPYCPLNWPRKKKIVTTVLYGLTTGGSSWLSSVYAPAVGAVADEFGVANEVSTLGLTLFLFGFGLGPLIWAPVSELFGRRMAVFPQYFIAACFVFGTATAKDLQTVLITRFFAGFFSAAPVSNTGGVLGDIWHPAQRGVAVLAYSMSVNCGPMLSPIVASAIVPSYLGWRWTHYLTGIMMLAILLVDVLVLDETYHNYLLIQKAGALRQQTRDWGLHAKAEETPVNISLLAHKFLVRPFQLLATPICFFMVLYSSFVYGLVYLNFSAFPIEFQEVRGWSPIVSSLPYLSILIGCAIGGLVCYLNQGFFIRHLNANNGKPVPEARLPVMMVGSFSVPIGLFIFAWTSHVGTLWVGSMFGAAMMGVGFFCIFQGSTNYLVDTFQGAGVSASAIAANTLVRNSFAGSFPLFTEYMFHAMGVDWAESLLGFVALALIPIPIVFYVFGKRIRLRGEWSRASAQD